MLDSLPASSWSFAHAAHLLNRAGFGGSIEDIRMLQNQGMDGAVNILIRGHDDSDLFPPPEGAQPQDLQARREMLAITDPQKRAIAQKQIQMQRRDEMLSLRAWWMDRMRYSTWPLREKMALFWHGHFATSMEKVHDAYWMYLQNVSFREHGLGSCRDLTKWMTRDAAMLRWLDLAQSNVQHPNENFARELMELFTLGEGHYTEHDIRESARAFTGYRINPLTQEFFFIERQHDNGSKTFMGKTGNFDGDGIIDIIFEQPQCARFLARKLWTYFAYENPPDGLVDILAQTMRDKDYQIAGFLSMLFRSAEFYSKKAFRSQVKSPVQWLVQTSKSLETSLPDDESTDGAMRQMGQVLFAPPNVKGWDGNRAWISTSTLLFRYNLAGYFVSAHRPQIQGVKQGRAIPLNLENIAPAAIRNDDEQLVSTLETRLFNAPLPAKERAACLIYAQRYHGEMSDERIRDLILMMMSTPDFQLT